ncbi:hypothetical protein N7532_003274 [Penicillium argentinense]|uniref:Uncharacterized protein n=1 Tax=Penicillium argentinense TaxID=1131581 RepID=A0A9W9FM57_9EURO|nr:uncharacterized protein N7532_003274 [Penicillium argentinense]KAJ5102745.1 hypothetical protein N7532_003274 [Penicillium argentinense]
MDRSIPSRVVCLLESASDSRRTKPGTDDSGRSDSPSELRYGELPSTGGGTYVLGASREPARMPTPAPREAYEYDAVGEVLLFAAPHLLL